MLRQDSLQQFPYWLLSTPFHYYQLLLSITINNRQQIKSLAFFPLILLILVAARRSFFLLFVPRSCFLISELHYQFLTLGQKWNAASICIGSYSKIFSHSLAALYFLSSKWRIYWKNHYLLLLLWMLQQYALKWCFHSFIFEFLDSSLTSALCVENSEVDQGFLDILHFFSPF